MTQKRWDELFELYRSQIHDRIRGMDQAEKVKHLVTCAAVADTNAHMHREALKAHGIPNPTQRQVEKPVRRKAVVA